MIKNDMQLEVKSVGTGHIVHSRQSGAMILANSAALALLKEKLDKSDGPICDEAQLLLDDWRSAGLFESSRPLPDPVAWRTSVGTVEFLELNGRQVTLRCEDSVLAEDFAQVLAPMRAAGSAANTSRIDVICDTGDFAVFRNGLPVSGRCDIYVARHLVLREVLTMLQGEERIGAVLHAAAVSRDGDALVLAGESGAGKSTMAMRLLMRGWHQVADDIVGLDIHGAVTPFPTRMAIKPGSWPLADQQVLKAAPSRSVGEIIARYLDTTARAPADRLLHPRMLIFPEYGPGATLRTERITPENAFLRLIECGARVSGATKSVAALAHFVQHTPAYLLNHGGGETAEATCEALFETERTDI